MTTRLVDLVTHDNWVRYFQLLSLKKSALFRSGIITRTAEFDAKATAGGNTTNMPFYEDLPDIEPNTSTDDPASSSSPNKITTGQDVAALLSKNQSWASMDLNVEVNQDRDDPMARIFGRVGNYWLEQNQKYLIAALTGVFADNLAADAGDLVHDVSALLDPTLSAINFVDATQKLGDAKDKITAVAVHSAVQSVMAKADLIDFIPDSEGAVTVPTFMGKRVIADDDLPFDGGTGVFTSYAIAQGAFAWGEGKPKVPTETERDPSAGDGAGQDILHSRRSFIMHPRGFAWDSGQANPTMAQLALAANWTRKWDRKHSRFIAIQSKLS